jgi:hypothetical protein
MSQIKGWMYWSNPSTPLGSKLPTGLWRGFLNLVCSNFTDFTVRFKYKKGR